MWWRYNNINIITKIKCPTFKQNYHYFINEKSKNIKSLPNINNEKKIIT